jgi:hypothetical protein
MVELEAAPGIVSIGGDPEVARHVVVSLAVELATNAWSEESRVRLVGFGDDLGAIAPDRIIGAPDLDRVLEELTQITARQVAACEALGLTGVLQARQLAGDRSLWRPEFLVLSAAPTPVQAEQLSALADDPCRAVGVLVVGDVASARWRLVVDSHGRLSAPALGLQVDAQQLRPQEYRVVERMLLAAGRDAGGGAAQVADPTPADVRSPRDRLADLLAPASAGAAPSGEPDAPAVAVEPGYPYPVEVRLLGPLTVTAPGPLAEGLRDLATEIVVATALHPAGLHPHVLAGAVWPRGADDSVVATAIGAVQTWLGAASDGLPRLRVGPDGRWHLTDDVRVDWHVFRTLAERAVTAVDPWEDLCAALALVRGEAWSDLPPGRYAWLVDSRVEHRSRAVVVEAARALADRAVARGDHSLAVDALRTGLSMAPVAESLWTDLIRLEHERGGPSAARRVSERMYATLAQRGVPGGASPHTDALVDVLLPGLRGTVA